MGSYLTDAHLYDFGFMWYNAWKVGTLLLGKLNDNSRVEQAAL